MKKRNLFLLALALTILVSCCQKTPKTHQPCPPAKLITQNFPTLQVLKVDEWRPMSVSYEHWILASTIPDDVVRVDSGETNFVLQGLKKGTSKMVFINGLDTVDYVIAVE